MSKIQTSYGQSEEEEGREKGFWEPGSELGTCWMFGMKQKWLKLSSVFHLPQKCFGISLGEGMIGFLLPYKWIIWICVFL